MATNSGCNHISRHNRSGSLFGGSTRAPSQPQSDVGDPTECISVITQCHTHVYRVPVSLGGQPTDIKALLPASNRPVIQRRYKLCFKRPIPAEYSTLLKRDNLDLPNTTSSGFAIVATTQAENKPRYYGYS